MAINFKVIILDENNENIFEKELLRADTNAAVKALGFDIDAASVHTLARKMPNELALYGIRLTLMKDIPFALRQLLREATDVLEESCAMTLTMGWW